MAGIIGLLPGDVRSRVAAGLLGPLAPLGFHESPYVALRLPDSDGIVLQTLTFAVGLGATRFLAGRQSRTQNPGHGVHAETDVFVRFLARLRVENEPADYDQALAYEAAIVDALRSIEPDPGLTIHLTGVPRRDNPPGMAVFAGEISATCHHLYPLG